jgi:hypothetical protein
MNTTRLLKALFYEEKKLRFFRVALEKEHSYLRASTPLLQWRVGSIECTWRQTGKQWRAERIED